MSAIPATQEEALATLSDHIRDWLDARQGPNAVRQLAHEVCADYPLSVRPARAEIDRVVDQAGTVRRSVAAVAALTGSDPASERYLAERLAESALREELRFIAEGPEAGWRAWGGDAWEPCPEQVPKALADAVHRQVVELLSGHRIDSRIASRLESTAAMRAIRTQLESYPQLRLDPQAMDPTGRLAVVGGCLDPVQGVVEPSDPAVSTFVRRCAVSFDAHAEHPAWTQISMHVAAQALGDVVQRYVGASLLGAPPDRKLLVLCGEGADGKSTFLRALHLALGGFAAVIPAEGLAGGGRGAHGHELLHGLSTARLGVALETPAELDWSLLKAISGADPRTSKRMHGRASTMATRCWLVLATNEAPKPPDAAAADRIILTRWHRPVEPDPEIARLLSPPSPSRSLFLRSALRWAVEGCRKYVEDGFSLGVPDFARPAIEHQGLAGWWEAEIAFDRIRPGHGWSAFSVLAERARRWCMRRGEESPTDTAIGTFLRTRVASGRRRILGQQVMAYAAAVPEARAGEEA